MDVILLNDARFGDGDRLVQPTPHVLRYFGTQKNLRPFPCESQCHDGRVAPDLPPVTLRLGGSRNEGIEELVVGNETPGTQVRTFKSCRKCVDIVAFHNPIKRLRESRKPTDMADLYACL